MSVEKNICYRLLPCSIANTLSLSSVLMEESRKREGGEKDEGVSGKRARAPVTSEETRKCRDDEDEDLTAWLSIDEEAVSELSKLLETEETSPVPVKVKFIDDPYSLPLIFQSSSSYVTINGNEESCGSSFSESESSVMAGIDIFRPGFHFYGGSVLAEDVAVWLNDGEFGRGEVAAEVASSDGFVVKQTNGCDCSDIDDEMLARFIGEELFD